MLPPDRVTIGTMNFGARTPAAEAHRIVDRAIERGATLFDTANMYGDGESERILGAALKGRRDSVQIATKVGLLRQGGKVEGLSPARMLAALNESLTRLQTDVVDLYYLHAPDHHTPIEQTLDGVAQLLESKKIRAWAVSNYGAWQLAEMMLACDARGLPRPARAQMLYNVLIRQLELEFFAFARARSLHVTVYNPLAGGVLARTPEPGADFPPGSRFASNVIYRKRYWTDALFDLAQRIREAGQSAGVAPVTLAYAWLAGRPGVDSVIAGPASVEHLDAAFDGCGTDLPPALRARVDEVYRSFVGTDACYAR